MVISGLVLTGLAALAHVFIFYLESLSWTSKKTRAVFRITEEQALATKEFAFNQGFYNLFLAVETAAGIGLFLTGRTDVGVALVLAGAGSMVAASLVLGLGSPDKRGAALKQGLVPALGLAAFLGGLAL